MYYRRICAGNSTVFRSIPQEEVEERRATGEDIVEEETVKEATQSEQKSRSKSIDSIIGMLPFMDEEDIGALIDKLIEGTKPFPEERLYPFASEKDLERLFIHRLLQKQRGTAGIAPFLAEKSLAKAVDMVLDGRIEPSDMDALYPFMSKGDIKRLFAFALQKRKQEDREEAA